MTGEDNFDDKHKLNSALVEIERLRAELAKCGKENCVGRIIDGYAEWVRAERLEKAEAQLATAQATYLQFCKKHDEKIDEACGIIHDLLGLERGSSERAMAFLDAHSPAADDVRGALKE